MSKLEIFSEKTNGTIEIYNQQLESNWDNGCWEHGSHWANYNG